MSHTSQLSRDHQQAYYPSRGEALQDMARRAGEITGTFIDPEAFSHMVHGDHPEWVAEWTRTDMARTVEIYRCADQDRIGLATVVALLGSRVQSVRDATEAGSTTYGDVLAALDGIRSSLSMVERALTREEAREARCREALLHSCAFCESGFVTESTDDLRWAGWRRRGGHWVCPDCTGEDQ